MNINLAPFSSSTFASSDCWVIHNSPLAARPDLGLKEGEAARLALQELEKLKGTDVHRLSLAPAVHSLQQLQLLFQCLDKYLFRKVLKDNVSLRFTSELPASIHGCTSALGSFSSQIVITLNSDLIRHPTQLALVASLTHQMSHAYLLVCCGFGDSDGEDERHDLKHGLAFSSIVHTIQDLLVDDAMIPLPDLFYCNGTMSRSARLPRYRPGRQSLHSYCHFNISDHEGKIACAAYMRHVIATAKAKSSESSSKEDPPSADVFQSIGTLGGLMNSAQLQNLYRVQGHLYPFLHLPPTSSAGTAEIPTSGDYQALMNLQTFLSFGDYDPKIVSGLDNSKMEGPPRLYVDDKHKIKESSPTNPLHDLRTYILALRTSVEPLRRFALVRLYSQRLLKKEIDAMHFLEEMYTGASSGDGGPGATVQDYKPDEDLRRFVQAFLCAAHPDLPTESSGMIELEYKHTIWGTRVTSEKDTEPATKDNTNLHILQTTDKYSGRLSKLRANGGLFLEDLDKVQSALGSKEPIKPPDDLLAPDAKGGALPVPDTANAGLASGLLGSRAVLERLKASEEQRHAYALYQQYLRRRPLLGLGAAPVSVGDLVDDVRLEDLERLSRLRL